MSCEYRDCRVPESRHAECAAKGISKCWPEFVSLTAEQFDRGVTNLQHQHTPKRSQGGKECHVMLCAGHHDNIDNGTRYEGLRLRDHVWIRGDIPHEAYVIEDRDSGEVLVEIELTGSE